MKCNALECLLKIQAQKGVANEKVPSINSMGKNKDSDVKAIGVYNDPHKMEQLSEERIIPK